MDCLSIEYMHFIHKKSQSATNWMSLSDEMLNAFGMHALDLREKKSKAIAVDSATNVVLTHQIFVYLLLNAKS